MTTWSLHTARGITPDAEARAALETARDALPSGVLFAAVVDGDEAWPRILDKAEAIEACRHGLVALRAVEPAMVLVRGDLPADFAATARLLTAERGYLVPGARATRSGRPPRIARLRLLAASFWTREERLWQLFRRFA
jgi:hypothetical protein